MDKNNVVVRSAIYKAHNGTDFYDNRFIEYDDLEIDHIIPEKPDISEKELKEYFGEIGIKEGFEINSLNNFVPTSRKNNRRKTNSLLPPLLAFKAISTAEKKVDEIRRLINKYEKDKKISELLPAIKKNISTKYEFENLYYEINLEEKREFEEQCIVQSGIFNTFTESTKKIRLDAYLPSFNSIRTACSISFKTLTLKDLFMDITDSIIVNSLFKGIYTIPDLNLREIVLAPINNYRGIYYITIGSAKLILDKEETYDLCRIIDSYYKSYIQKLNEVEEVLGTREFKLGKKGHRLIKIRWRLWQIIQDFIYSLDNNRELKEKWNIFESNPFMIKIFTDNHPDYENGYHAIIFHETDFNEFIEFYNSTEKEIWLTWEPLNQIFTEEDVKKFNKRKEWNAQMCFSFITKELIPNAILFNKKKNKEISSKTKFDEFVKCFDISHHVTKDTIEYIDFKRELNKIDLLFIFNKLQGFYRNSQSMYMTKDAIRGLYYSVKEVIRHTEKIPFQYIKGNLGFVKANTISELISDIDNYISEQNDKIVSCFEIDTALRCPLVCLRDYECDIPQLKINEIYLSLKSLIKKYNEETLIYKNQS